MAESKVDGAVDDLLLGDGFSIVDSTKGDSGEGADTKKATPKKKSPPPKKKSPPPKKKSPTPKKKSPPQKTEVKKEVVEETKPEAVVKQEVVEEEVKEAEPAKDESESKINGHDANKSDALLLTTEEDLELTEKDKKSEPEPVDNKKDKEEKPKSESKSTKTDVNKRKQGDVWVSNITRSIKATDLKKHFSRHGKVQTAKIVTNGKLFFGYILMENADVANKCVKNLHGSLLEGKKISVSRQRPDQRRTITEKQPSIVKPSKIEKKSEKKPEKKPEDKKSVESTRKSADTKKDDALIAARRNEDRLRRECDYLKREINRLKRFLSDEQRKVRIEVGKNRTLSRELQEVEGKLRDERRKVERERELFEKNQRTDRVKMENDRSLIKKELEEVKKLREYLKRKIEEEQQQQQQQAAAAAAAAARPVVESRRRAASPYAYSSKRFRDSSGADREKPSKYVEERTRTPPSPPKLSSRSKRSPVNTFSLEKDRRSGASHHYSVSDREEVSRHSSSIVIPAKPSAPAAPRNIWPSFHQEVWRVPPGTTPSAPFASSQSSYPRQSEYSSTSSSSKGASYSQSSRDFNKRDHYSSSSVRKY